jgi:hypothetical protein
MSNVNVADITRLAQVESAGLFEVSILGGPEIILQVTAQRSGFNWEVKVVPGDVDAPIVVEYLPYLVIETQTGPGWKPGTGQGPSLVVPPTTLQTVVPFRPGVKGIEVIGQGFRKNLDYPK